MTWIVANKARNMCYETGSILISCWFNKQSLSKILDQLDVTVSGAAHCNKNWKQSDPKWPVVVINGCDCLGQNLTTSKEIWHLQWVRTTCYHLPCCNLSAEQNQTRHFAFFFLLLIGLPKKQINRFRPYPVGNSSEEPLSSYHTSCPHPRG